MDSKNTVVLKELTKQYEKRNLNYKLPIILGVNEKKEAQFADLVDLKHILMCGSTGSGKSMFEHTIISTLISFYTSNQLKFYLVDMKLVEFQPYEGLSYLLAPINNHDTERIYAGLRWAIYEKDRRLKMGDEINKYPYIVIIIDTFSDLIAHDPVLFEYLMGELIDKNTAGVKIHVIMSDSRPSPDVYTSLILSLFPTKICFNVNLAEYSKLIIGAEGGEKLKGKGDMLFLPPNRKEAIGLQAPYIDYEEINMFDKVLDKVNNKNN